MPPKKAPVRKGITKNTVPAPSVPTPSISKKKEKWRCQVYLRDDKRQSWGPDRLSHVQAHEDWKQLSKCTTQAAFAKVKSELPSDLKPFTTDIIVDEGWTPFVSDDSLQQYRPQFLNMFVKVDDVQGCRETWSTWFAELGWVGACQELGRNADITSEECYKFFCHRVSPSTTTCPENFFRPDRT